MFGKRIGFLSVVFFLVLVASALGEIQVNEFDVNLHGRWWHVLSYWVQDDLLIYPADNTFLEPEGLAFADGILYVSGDRGQFETDSRLALYSHPPGGTLTFSGYLQMTLAPDGWGPEGLVFNNSGSGYGSGVSQLVSVELDGGGQTGIIDLITGNVTDNLTISPAEDVAYVASESRFATLEDAGGPVTVTFYDQTFVPTGDTITVAPATNGMVSVSASFASFLTRTTVAGECLLTVTKENPGNAINVYDLQGAAIGDQQDLPVEPEARIPIGGGFYLTRPAFLTVEAVTVNEAEQVIYVGDEDNTMVHVFTPGLLVGDIDGDGDKDMDDVIAFVAVLLDDPMDPKHVDRSDINADMLVNGLDTQFFVDAVTGP